MSIKSFFEKLFKNKKLSINQLAIINEIADSIRSSSTTYDIFQKILDAAIKVSGAKNGQICLVDGINGDLFKRAFLESETNDFKIVEDISTASIPLLINNEIQGIVFINFRKQKIFDKETVDTITLFANYASLAIHNFNVLNQATHYSQQLQVLNEIGKELSSSLLINDEQVLSVIHSQTNRLMNTDNFFIAFFDYKSKGLSFKYVIDEGKKIGSLSGEWSPRINGDGLSEYVIRNKKPLLIQSGMINFMNENDIQVVGKEAKSWLGAPMILREDAIGIIALQNYDNEYYFSPQDRDVLSTIANQAAIAIDNIHLMTQAKNTIFDLEKLGDLSNRILLQGDLSRIMSDACIAACELTGCDLAMILTLHSPENNKIYFENYYNNSGIQVNSNLQIGNYLNSDEGIIGLVSSSKKPIIVDDVSIVPEYFEVSVCTKSEICVPLFQPLKNDPSGYEFIGVLNVESKTLNFFDDIDLVLLQKLATQISIAIQQSKRVDELERYQNYLQDAQNLAEFGLLYGEDLHLANNRLGAARTFAENITRFSDLDRAKKYANLIRKNIVAVLDVIDDIRNVVNPPELFEFNVHDLLDSTIAGQRVSSIISIIRKYGDIDPFVLGYKRQIGQVFRVIYFNAVDAINGEGELTQNKSYYSI